MMREVIVGVVLLGVLVFLMIRFRIRENRYLKKKTSDVMSLGVRDLLNEEKRKSVKNRESFSAEMDRAREKSKKDVEI